MRYFLVIIIVILNLLTLQAQVCVGNPAELQWNCWRQLYDNEPGELTAEEDYPLRPDVTQTIFKTQSPVNFDNMMGGMIRGFISVPQSDNVIFNITGDDRTRFYLSSDSDPSNMVLEAYTDNWTNIAEHDKYPEQTTDSIFLQSGNFYYFELRYVEGYGGDHITLYWKTDNVDPLEWNIITSAFIHDVACLPAACPPRETPCDDGDPATSEDMEDGFCNCTGTPNTNNSCIGPRAEITMYAYDSIPGSSLNDLYASPDFPAMPDRSKRLPAIAEPYANDVDSTGTLIQGYLSVPVTGGYKFNVTGNNETIFFLSSDDDPANKQAHQVFVAGSTDPTQHDKYIFQSTSFITLNAGQYYYFELNHKEGSYSEHFSVFWQAPFTEPGVWKRIPDFYTYSYECTLACIPQGSPCDDGDPFTNNDMYDANCECVGTPCTGAACNDPLASYDPYPKCSATDQLDNRSDVNWLSCSLTANPNALRPTSHWIKYDFGQSYQVLTSHVWNYNASGSTSQGFETAAIDYSEDGSTWTELGIYNWSLAPGDDEYSGFIGPDFGGVNARYVLITSLDDPNTEACRGLGKMTFTAALCTTVGNPCDDGNPQTANDTINEQCICVGDPIALNDCLIDHLVLGDTLIPGNNYSAILTLNSANTLQTNSSIYFVAGEELDLLPGFEAPLSTEFTALIEPCPSSAEEDEVQTDFKKPDPGHPLDYLKVLEIQNSDQQIIEFLLDAPGRARIEIFDPATEQIYTLIDAEFGNRGIYHKRLRTKKLAPGVYQVTFKGDKVRETEKMIVL